MTESASIIGEILDPQAEDRLMTVGEVAAFLQVAEIFVYRHAREIGAFKVGSHLRFRKSKVEEWLAGKQLGGDRENCECRSSVDNELMERLLARSKGRRG